MIGMKVCQSEKWVVRKRGKKFNMIPFIWIPRAKLPEQFSAVSCPRHYEQKERDR